jgi:uroporphyrinogen decarboxylase
MMRQAGRYLPEYREIRSRSSFLEMCHDADLAAEVTLQPLRRFPFDAGILFSDILVVPQAMGMTLEFGAGHGPRFPEPLRSREDIEALRPLDPWSALPAPLAALRQLKERSPVPVLGFCGAPFTLACYMIQGEGSPEWPAVRALIHSDPAAFQALLDRLSEAVGAHLQAQIEAGAAAVQLFDTWAGALPAEEARRWAIGPAAAALSRVKGAPRLYFSRATRALLPWLRETGADAFALDHHIGMAEARRGLGEAPVQGNLDPEALRLPPAELQAEVRRIIREAGPRGHVFNLGHGITPDTPIAGVAAAVESVRAWTWS